MADAEVNKSRVLNGQISLFTDDELKAPFRSLLIAFRLHCLHTIRRCLI